MHDIPADEIRQIATRHGAMEVRIFGSRARGEASDASDLDLLVQFEPGRTLLDAIGLEQELADLPGYPVQVVTQGALSPHLKDRVLTEAVPL